MFGIAEKEMEKIWTKKNSFISYISAVEILLTRR